MKKFKTLPLMVEASDIEGVGGTVYWPDENGGNTAFILSKDDGGIHIQLMFLRTILQCFGEEYKILSTADFAWHPEAENIEDQMWDVEVYTNLPKELYEEASKDNFYRNLPEH